MNLSDDTVYIPSCWPLESEPQMQYWHYYPPQLFNLESWSTEDLIAELKRRKEESKLLENVELP